MGKSKPHETDSGEQPQPVVIQGWVYRESSHVSGVCNQRYGVLHPHSFVTARKDTSHPSKVWPLHGLCQLSRVQQKDYMVRDRHTSTLWALAAGRYEKKALYQFTVSWPKNSHYSRDDLTLALEDEDLALRWREAFKDTILDLKSESGLEASANSSPSRLAGSNSPFKRTTSSSASMSASAGRPGATGSMPTTSDRPSADRELHGPAHGSGTATARITMQSPRTTSSDAFDGIHQQKSVGFERNHSQSGEFYDSLPRLEGALSLHGEGSGAITWQPPKRKWASFRHVNGVAIYQEAEGADGQGGACMVSAVVRSHPRAAFKALMEQTGDDMPFQLNTAVLENLDHQSRIIKSSLEPVGYLSKLCAPREVVLQQTWREDDDGTFIVLMRSTSHRKAREAASGWLGYGPIRAQVAAAGYTIAPLQSRFIGASGSSTECLVTLVLKLDLGGWLSERSGVGWLLSPVVRKVVDSYVEPMLMSVISLRDKVEQERFVVKPFSLGQQSDPEKYERGGMASADRLPSWVPPSKTFTLGTRKLQSLLAQRSSMSGAEALGPESDPLNSVSGPGPSVSAAAVAEGDGPGPEFAQGTLDPKYWSCPGAAGFRVRGVNYLKDKKKSDAEEPVFGLASVDLVETEAPCFHVAQHLPSIKHSKAPFTFVVQLMVPGPPFLALTMAFAADHDPCAAHSGAKPQTPGTATSASSVGDGDSDDELGRAPFDLCLARFLAGDDAEAEERRHRTFKLIPSVVKGSWVIKQSVGNTPVLLGRKLKTRYFRGPGYFEVDVDVGSSRTAASVVGLVSGATTSLVIDMAILLEGHTSDELPEFLLGTVRFSHLDLKQAAYLDLERGTIHPKGT